MLGIIFEFSSSVPNLSGGSKETHTVHIPTQVTTGACLFRSGTYRAQRDKVHVICFPEKVSPRLEEIYKKRLQLQGLGICLHWGHAFPMAGGTCWGTLVPGTSRTIWTLEWAVSGDNCFSVSPNLVLSNLRNWGHRLKKQKPFQNNPPGSARVQWGMSEGGGEGLGPATQVSDTGRA